MEAGIEMRSIQRLRWLLVAGALLLVGVLAAYLGYGRYRQMALRRILERSGITVTRDTNGVTYSQSVGGKTIFTLHAAKATQIGDGKWALHNADMTLYSRMPDRPDHIYGAEFEYDEKQGIARALGEVHMDLQAPQGISRGGKPADPATARAEAESTEVIHVRTSSVVYLRHMGVAATDQPIEFRYGGMECTAQGAEFDTGQNILHLLADVRMDGLARGRPVHLTAIRADLDRTANTANLVHTVVASDGRTASSDAAVLSVRKDGSVERVVATGNVVLSADTQQIKAARLDALLGAQSLPQTAKLSGGVILTDTSTTRPMQGKAAQVDVAFNPLGGPRTMTATGGVNLSSVDRVQLASGLAREFQGQTMVASFVPVQGKNKSSVRLSELHATGAARGRAEVLANRKPAAAQVNGVPSSPLLKTQQIAADDLRMGFVATGDGRVELRRLDGVGHTMLQQDAPMGEQEVSTGQALVAILGAAPAGAASRPGTRTGMNPGGLTLASAVQTGHVEIHQRSADKVAADGKQRPGTVSNASAERAAYDGETEQVTLTGSPRLAGDTAMLTASTVVVDQRTGDAKARGAVQTVFESAPEGASGPAASGPAASGPAASGPAGSGLAAQARPVTHVLSASAKFDHETRQMEFHGTDAEPAKMWQDASQVQAATLLFDGVRRTFSARPAVPGALVHAVFVGSRQQAKAGDATVEKKRNLSGFGDGGAARVVRIASPKMDYNEVQREATFTGGARMDGSMGELRSQRVVIFLSSTDKAGEGKLPKAVAREMSAEQANPLGGSLERAVAYGDVQMAQPGRQGTGDELLYTSATDNFILTGTPGHPPHIVDAKQGSVTGATLLFGQSGSTIVVAGETVPGKTTRSRIRTETETRP